MQMLCEAVNVYVHSSVPKLTWGSLATKAMGYNLLSEGSEFIGDCVGESVSFTRG